MTPHEARDIIQEMGYRAKLGDEEDRCTGLRSSAEGIDFGVYFFRDDPAQGDLSTFDNISFMANLGREKNISLTQINQWNAESFYGKLYLEEGDVWLEMNTNASSEWITPDALRIIVYDWTQLLIEMSGTELKLDKEVS